MPHAKTQRAQRIKQCPCGCGKELHPYNGRVPLVCYDVWQKVPHEDRILIMMCERDSFKWRSAARRVLRLARQAYPVFCAWCREEGQATQTGWSSVEHTSGICGRHAAVMMGEAPKESHAKAQRREEGGMGVNV